MLVMAVGNGCLRLLPKACPLKRDAKAREKPAPAKPLSHIHSILGRLATYREELDTTFRQPVPYN